METLIDKIKNLRNNGHTPYKEGIEFLGRCKTPREALEKAPLDYLRWLLGALKVDFKKERADYCRSVMSSGLTTGRSAISSGLITARNTMSLRLNSIRSFVLLVLNTLTS